MNIDNRYNRYRYIEQIYRIDNSDIDDILKIKSSQLSDLGHWSGEPQIPSLNPPETFVKSYFNNFLKVIFLAKNAF